MSEHRATALGPAERPAGAAPPGGRPPAPGRRGAGRARQARAPRSPLRAAAGVGGEIVTVLASALLLSLLVKTFLVQAFYIPSASMERTLLVDDRVLVSKLSPRFLDLHRGDVVVFDDPGGWLQGEQAAAGGHGVVGDVLSFLGLAPNDADGHLVKRVIGVGGDHVTCCDSRGRVAVDGVPLDEAPYVAPGASPSASPCERRFDVTVPPGFLWVMGDNRPVSGDSRCHQQLDRGLVPLHDVVGKAFAVVWPLDRVAGLGVPGSVFARVPAASP